MRAGRRQISVIALAALLITLGLAAWARAETTRADYIAAVEPICEANTDANRRILRGVRNRVKHDELGRAARQFRRAAHAFAGTVDSLKAVPQPSDDASLLATWFRYLDQETGYLERIAVALKREQRGRAQSIAVRLRETANHANGAVTGYGFRACLINPSKFT